MSMIEVCSVTASPDSWASPVEMGAVVSYASNKGSAEIEGLSLSSSNALRSSNRKRRSNVERKLRGFVVQFETETVRVLLFGPGDRQYEYRFSAKRFREAGITAENQPFEFEESRVFDESGSYYKTQFKPMAAVSSGTVGTLNLGEGYQQKLTKVLSHFGKRENLDASA